MLYCLPTLRVKTYSIYASTVSSDIADFAEIVYNGRETVLGHVNVLFSCTASGRQMAHTRLVIRHLAPPNQEWMYLGS